MSACQSTINVNEVERISDPIPGYAHCFVYDGAVETTEPMQPTTLSAISNFTLSYSNMGIPVTKINSSDQNNDCKVHSRTGYIVALATVTTFTLILLGYIMVDKVRYVTSQLHSKRQRGIYSSSESQPFTQNKKRRLVIKCESFTKQISRFQPQDFEMQPSKKNLNKVDLDD